MSKILALDVGEKRVGLAVSDESGAVAFPRGMVLRKNLVGEIERLVREEHITTVVIGLPLGEENEETERTKKIRALGDTFKEKCDVPVVYVDEFLSTHEALSKIPFRKARRKKGEDDAMAAQVILERYLVAGAGFGHASRRS